MLQTIMGQARKAIDDFNMIDDNDKIAVGLSGGKDSIALLHTLHYLQKFYPKKFDLIAITIHPGTENFKTDKLEKMCKELNIEYIVYNSNITEVVFDIRKEKNPCSLCANMRRGMLNSLAVEHGCNKIALGHHSDDVVETFLMSLFLNSNIHTFSPVTYLSRSNIKTIRPFVYVAEKEIRKTAKELNFPIVDKTCPMDGYSKREYIKTLLKDMGKDIPRVKTHIFGAIRRSDIYGWKVENFSKQKNINSDMD